MTFENKDELSCLTFAHCDECWKKDENPFKEEENENG